MRVFWLFCWITFLFSQQIHGATDLKKIIRAIQKQDFIKALELLDDDLREYPVNPGSKLIYARLLSADTLDFYDLDKSRRFINEALADYENADPKLLEEFVKLGFAKNDLTETYDSIREKTFNTLATENSVNSYISFLNIYPDSPQRDLAIKRRDSLAYDEARQVNTWPAYEKYLNEYPQSIYGYEARQKYELLLFQERVASRDVHDYERFINDFPNSPYVAEALRYIFKYGTLNNDFSAFEDYIRKYPDSPLVRQAVNILYHIDAGSLLNSSLVPDPDLFDSLLFRYNEDRIPLIPVVQNSKIGFVDFSGEWKISPTFHELLNKHAFCEILIDDVIVGSVNNIHIAINRGNTEIYTGNINHIKDVGQGAILFRSDDSGSLMHKSGFSIIENIDDAELFENVWFKVKRDTKWALISFTGVLLTEFRFDEIYELGKFCVFQRGDEIALSNIQSLSREVGEGGFTLEYKYDDFEFVNDSLLIGFKGDRECLVNDQLNFEIPWGLHTVHPDPIVNYAREGNKLRIYNDDVIRKVGTSSVEELIITNNWLAAKNTSWQLLNLATQRVYENLDSVKLINEYAVYISDGDSSRIMFPTEQVLDFYENQEVVELEFRNENGLISEYLLTGEEDISVWDQEGHFLFHGKFETIQCISDSLFRVTKNDKQGLIDRFGYYILDPDYDFIQYKDGLAIVLKDGKIGAYDFVNRSYISESYEASISRFGNNYQTKIEGKWGLINDEEVPVIPFTANEIKYLNDSSAWIMSDSSWVLVNISSGQILLSGISQVDQLSDELYQIITPKGYGVIGINGEIMVNPNFTDIQLIEFMGMSYLKAEHYVPEADIYVVVGYKTDGTRIFSEAYTESEYDAIYCE